MSALEPPAKCGQEPGRESPGGCVGQHALANPRLSATPGDRPALRMLNLQNLFRNDTRSVRRGTPGPRHLSTGFGPFPSRGGLDGFQRKANRKHIVFKQPRGHFQSDHVALRTFLSSFSENHSSSAPKALLRGLTPPASPGKATQPAPESASQASFLSTLPEPSLQPPACHFLDAPPGPFSQWVPNQLIFPGPGFPVSVDRITVPSATLLEMSESSLTHPSHSLDQTNSRITT